LTFLTPGARFLIIRLRGGKIKKEKKVQPARPYTFNDGQKGKGDRKEEKIIVLTTSPSFCGKGRGRSGEKEEKESLRLRAR